MALARILCIDDEPRVLEGIRRILRKSFDVTTAQSGHEALALLDRGESFEAVVSDMQMPQMTGAVLLAEFCKRAPDTVRVLLTGNANVDSAIAAVNRGHIFRFLTKPCPSDELASTLEAGVAQHRLLTAEKVLLEQTLVGSIRALTELLALAHPEVFGPRMRQHARVRAVAEQLGLAEAWQVEVASMLSSVGYAVLPSDVAVKLQVGAPLDGPETVMVQQIPGVVEKMLSHIPRLESVQALLNSYDALKPLSAPSESAPVGARILHAVTDLAVLEAREGDTGRALTAMRAAHRHSPDVIEALSLVSKPRAPEIRSLSVDEVRSGMVLAADVKARNGVLLMSHGQSVTAQLLQRMRNFHASVGVSEPILCEARASAA